MFFEISQVPRDTWSHIWRMGPLCVGTDAGWTQCQLEHCVFLYKGYAESAPLKTLLWQIHQQRDPVYMGNFCVLVWDTRLKVLSIKNDIYRSFPLYINEHHSVGNLHAQPTVAWADGLISIDQDVSVCYDTFDVVGDVTPQGRDLDWIDQRLRSRIQSVLEQNPQNLKIFLSGGVDTLLIYSYLVDLGADFDLVKGLHFDFDRFWLDNCHVVSQYWAYNQIHHWLEPCMLVSGAPGDEFMMRNPVTANLYLLEHDTTLLQELDRAPHCMHQQHFLKPKNTEVYKQQHSATDAWHLCNLTANDWQHWHLGNTLTWTPLRDLEIFKAMLHLPFDQVLDQILNSALSVRLMDRNVSGLSQCLSSQKNHGNVIANLRPLLLTNE